ADAGELADLLDAQLVGALFEQGDGFVVTASHGAVDVPAEAASASDAMGVADERMYLRKNRSGSRSESQTRDTLVRVIHARNSELSDELDRTARLAQAVARRLGMSDEDVQVVTDAALLVDLGKLAIPDAILLKAGAPTDEE